MTPKQTTTLLAVIVTLLIAFHVAFQWALNYRVCREMQQVTVRMKGER